MNTENQQRLLGFLEAISEHQPQLVATLQSIDRHLALVMERLDGIEDLLNEALPVGDEEPP